MILKRRPSEPSDGFDVPLLVPILGAIVCALLIGVRVQAAFIDPKPGAAVAPLIALAIFALSFVLYRLMKYGKRDPESLKLNCWERAEWRAVPGSEGGASRSQS